MDQKRSLKSYSYSFKQKIIKEYDQGSKIKELSEKYKMPRTTVSTIVHNRSKILQIDVKQTKCKRLRPAKYPEIEDSLMEFFDNCRNSNIPVSGSFIQETAKECMKEKEKEIPNSTIEMPQRSNISLKTKLEIINKYENGAKHSDLVANYNIHHSTMSYIIKNKNRYKENAYLCSDKISRVRPSPYMEMEKKLRIFCEEAQENGVKLSRSAVKEKALALAEEMGKTEFKASDHWLKRFSQRYRGTTSMNKTEILEEEDESMSFEFNSEPVPEEIPCLETQVFIKTEPGQVCRLCAMPLELSIDVTEGNNESLAYKIRDLLRVEITSEDNSHKICLDCHQRVEMCYEFFEEVQRAQHYFAQDYFNVEQQLLDPISAVFMKEEVESEPEIKVEKELVEPVEPIPPVINEIPDEKQTKLQEQSEELSKFYKFSCSECKVDLKYDTYVTHMKDTHQILNPTIVCCGISLPCIRVKLKEHYLVHTRSEEFKCRECGKQYLNKRNFSHHLKTHNRTIPCPHCDMMFFSTIYLKTHIVNRHTPDELKPKYQCDVCKIECTTKYTVLQHLIKMHKFQPNRVLSKNTEILCPHCAKSFHNKSSYEGHVKMKHNITLVECPDCKKQVNKEVLSGHRRQMHDHVAKACDVCFKVFRNIQLMRNHRRNVHGKPKLLKCDLCEKEFKSKGTLTDHRQSHFGIQFQCDVCGAPNNDYANVLKHRKQSHPNHEPIPHGMGRKILQVGYVESSRGK